MGLVILALVVLAVAAGVYRMWRRRRSGNGDLPAAVVGWVARLLSTDRAEWGRAMVGELAQYQGAARWQFALGCVVAAIGLPRRDSSGRWVVASVLVASIASSGLVGYAFVRVPGHDNRQGYVAGVGDVRGRAGGIRRGHRRHHAAVPDRDHRARLRLRSGRSLDRGRRGRAVRSEQGVDASSVDPSAGVDRGRCGRRAAWSDPVSGPAHGAGLSRCCRSRGVPPAGRRHTDHRRATLDAGQLRDFATSGYPDMASYAVSDDLGTAMVLLLFMSGMTALLGTAGATLATRRGR